MYLSDLCLPHSEMGILTYSPRVQARCAQRVTQKDALQLKGREPGTEWTLGQGQKNLNS